MKAVKNGISANDIVCAAQVQSCKATCLADHAVFDDAVGHPVACQPLTKPVEGQPPQSDTRVHRPCGPRPGLKVYREGMNRYFDEMVSRGSDPKGWQQC